jgi:hypothetical protein
MNPASEEKISCDILVAGGGVSGTAAALAAARGGAKTILIEKENVLGGTGYSGLLNFICGLYLNGDALPSETLNNGIVREVVALLSGISPHRKIKRIGRVYVLPYAGEDLLSVFSTLCGKEPKLSVHYNTKAVLVEKEDGLIMNIRVEQSGPLRSIFPKAVIDCSGSGDISAMAGASFELSSSEKLQLAGYTLFLKGLEDADETLSIKVPYYLAAAVKKKILSPYLRFTAFTPGDAPDEGYCKMSIDGIDGTEREQRARKDAEAAHDYLKNMLPSFKGSYIAGSSGHVMDREGRRISGEYTLTEEDVLNAGKFHDGVVKNSWPVEIWDKNRGTIYKYVKRGDYYEIPFRCLKVKGIANLFCAGRCISVTSEALGSTRVMGTCISLGEQAGRGAASMVMEGNGSISRDKKNMEKRCPL